MRLPARLERLPRPTSQLAGLLALWALAVVEVPLGVSRMASWGYTLHRLGYSDFGQYYLWARIGLHAGWNRLYDLTIQRQEWQALVGAGTTVAWWPNIDPPPQAWLAAPFALFPFPIAFAAWMVLIVAALVLTWRLCAPGTGLVRWRYLAAALAAFPVMNALMLGQALLLVAASVAASWWWLRRGRQVEAGLVLAVIVLKPQLAILVPLGLLVAGYGRAFLAWAAGVAVVTIITVVSLGPDGVSAYGSRLTHSLAGAGDWAPAALSVSGLMGAGVLTRAVQVVLALVTLRIIWRLRGHGPDLVFAAGLLGSMLLTPYVHVPDLALLLLAAAIFLQTDPTIWQRRLLVVLYVTLWSFLLTGDAGLQRPTTGMLMVPIELAWLGSILWTSVRPVTPRVQPGALAA